MLCVASQCIYIHMQHRTHLGGCRHRQARAHWLLPYSAERVQSSTAAPHQCCKVLRGVRPAAPEPVPAQHAHCNNHHDSRREGCIEEPQYLCLQGAWQVNQHTRVSEPPPTPPTCSSLVSCCGLCWVQQALLSSTPQVHQKSCRHYNHKPCRRHGVAVISSSPLWRWVQAMQECGNCRCQHARPAAAHLLHSPPPAPPAALAARASAAARVLRWPAMVGRGGEASTAVCIIYQSQHTACFDAVSRQQLQPTFARVVAPVHATRASTSKPPKAATDWPHCGFLRECASPPWTPGII